MSQKNNRNINTDGENYRRDASTIYTGPIGKSRILRVGEIVFPRTEHTNNKGGEMIGRAGWQREEIGGEIWKEEIRNKQRK